MFQALKRLVVLASSLGISMASYAMEQSEEVIWKEKISTFYKCDHAVKNNKFRAQEVSELLYDENETNLTLVEDGHKRDFLKTYQEYFDEVQNGVKKLADFVTGFDTPTNPKFLEQVSIPQIYAESSYQYFSNLFNQAVEELRSNLFFKQENLTQPEDSFLNSIGLVVVKKEDVPNPYLGVGSLLSQDVLITAKHNFKNFEDENSSACFLPFLTVDREENDFFNPSASFSISKQNIKEIGGKDVSLAKIDGKIERASFPQISSILLNENEELYPGIICEETGFAPYKTKHHFLGESQRADAPLSPERR